MFTTGLVLAAGSSTRLGQPKQLLPFRARTLLDATLDMARACEFDQLIVTVGGAGAEVRQAVDLTGCTVVESVNHGQGCSSSIVSALEVVDDRADGLVLLLGDQPDVLPETVHRVRDVGSCGVASMVIGLYNDGRGHPFWFARSMFAALENLHGDKAVWKLIESGRWPMLEIPVDADVPLDVDTWEAYERLVEQDEALGSEVFAWRSISR